MMTHAPLPHFPLNFQANGTDALVKHALRLGDIKNASDKIILDRTEMEKAWFSLTDGQREMLQRTK